MSTTADDALFPLEPQAGNTAPLPTQTRTISGWGRTAPSTGEVLSTSDPDVRPILYDIRVGWQRP